MYISRHLSLLLSAGIICLVSSLDDHYEEIRKLNASCSPKDTCSIPRDLDHFENHNCDCGTLCVLYDTCCIDSPVRNLSRQYERTFSCRSVGGGSSVFMVDDCQKSYDGPAAVRRRCEMNVKDWSDPFTNIPVTHGMSQKTYKSLFCAMCNNVKLEDLFMWQVVLDCSALGESSRVCDDDKDFVLSNMVYLHEKSQWGIWSFDPKTDWGFKFLTMNLKVPDVVKAYVKECRPNLVSDCDESWKDDRVRSLCKAYMGAVYLDEVAYRNVHCAICNHVENVTDFLSCHDISSPMFRGPMNFGVLLDIDLRDGLSVGRINKQCSVNQIYDPFAKKCRTIECALPGYIVKNQTCISG